MFLRHMQNVTAGTGSSTFSTGLHHDTYMNSREAEFNAAFEKHSDELFRHASMRLPSRDRALELTQETFLKVWQFLSKGEHIDKFRPFLYRVLNNLIIDEYRKHKTQSLDAMMEDPETASAVEGNLLRDEFDMMETASVMFDGKVVLEAIKKLPDMYRVVIIMRFIDGLTPSEIAGHIKETENTVSVRLHRGIRKLRELLTSIRDDSAYA